MEGEETKKNGGIELDWDKLNIAESQYEAYHYERLRRLSDVEILAIIIPDVEILANFKLYKNELERRKLLRLKYDGGCKKPKPLDISTSVDASDSCREGGAPSRSSSQSKLAACFVNKLDEHRTESFTPGAYEKKMSRETPFRSNGNLSGDTKKRNVSNSPRPPYTKRICVRPFQGQTSSHERHGKQKRVENASLEYQFDLQFTIHGEHVVEELEAKTMATQENRIGERDDSETGEISYSDIQCLAPGKYLPTTIMNFYIRYLQGQTSPSGSGTGGSNYHLCNTYFYEKLKEAVTGKFSIYQSMEEDPLAKFRQWWEHVKKSERAYVLLPIHEKYHWSLVIICIPEKKSRSGPKILHLNSLVFHVRKPIFSNIRRFLRQEALVDLQQKLPWFLVKVPTVRNFCDRRLFVLFFMKKFIAEAPKRPKKMFGEYWFKHGEAMSLMDEIKTLVKDIRVPNLAVRVRKSQGKQGK